MFRIFHFTLGFSVLVILSLLMSTNPKKIRIRYILQLLIIEILCGYFIFHSTTGLHVIHILCSFLEKLINFTTEGTNFVFGGMREQKLATFFLNTLCPIIFISALIGILQYTHILKFIIKTIGTILSKISGMGKLESFNVISSLILGQSENFIIYKDRITNIPELQLYTMAVTAMSTVSLPITGAYMKILIPHYVIAALILNIFSTFIILSLINPYIIDTQKDLNISNCYLTKHSFFETIGEYILIGLKIIIIITAMLIGFIALISAFNSICITLFNISFQEILGYIFLPLALIMGIPLQEVTQVSNIMAMKLITNEFIAMINLQSISHTLSSKSIGITSVFLVSFSNFTSIGIITGAIRSLNATQGKIISHYGFKLIYSSTLINALSAIVTGLII